MIVTRTSDYSGIERTLELPVTLSQFEQYNLGALIQDAFPDLTDFQREFIKSGITREEWNEMMEDQ